MKGRSAPHIPVAIGVITLPKRLLQVFGSEEREEPRESNASERIENKNRTGG